jgi:S1-C subfamily serine protease
VAFQGATSGQNIGYMVPAPIVNHFLTDISDGTYSGFPELGIFTQKMENPDIREKYRMKDNHSGVLVTEILHESPSKGIINTDDIILSVDGTDIENDGSVEFRAGERTSFNYVVQKKFINDTIAVKVLREGAVKDLKVKLTVPMYSTRLVPLEQYETPPAYYIAGGIVFAPLTKNYLFKWGNQWFYKAPTKLLDLYYYGVRAEDKKEVVLLSKVLADEINLGYHDLHNLIITKINDKKISSMKDVVDIIENSKDIYLIIEDDSRTKVILRKDQVDKYSDRILQTYRIASDRSDDLKLK